MTESKSIATISCPKDADLYGTWEEPGPMRIGPKLAEHISTPKRKWREMYILNTQKDNSLYQPDIHIRDGTIVPIGNLNQSTEDFSTDSLNNRGLCKTLYHSLFPKGFPGKTTFGRCEIGPYFAQ